MNTSAFILVIILSIVLAIFLVVGIVIAVQIAKLLKTLNRVAQKAEDVVDSAEHVGQIFQDVGGKLAALRVLHNIVDAVTQHNKRGK
jgi:predicted PurR-regulated permease PerM